MSLLVQIKLNKKLIDCFISLASSNPNFSWKIFLHLICTTFWLDYNGLFHSKRILNYKLWLAKPKVWQFQGKMQKYDTCITRNESKLTKWHYHWSDTNYFYNVTIDLLRWNKFIIIKSKSKWTKNREFPNKHCNLMKESEKTVEKESTELN